MILHHFTGETISVVSCLRCCTLEYRDERGFVEEERISSKESKCIDLMLKYFWKLPVIPYAVIKVLKLLWIALFKNKPIQLQSSNAPKSQSSNLHILARGFCIQSIYKRKHSWGKYKNPSNWNIQEKPDEHVLANQASLLTLRICFLNSQND